MKSGIVLSWIRTEFAHSGPTLVLVNSQNIPIKWKTFLYCFQVQPVWTPIEIFFFFCDVKTKIQSAIYFSSHVVALDEVNDKMNRQIDDDDKSEDDDVINEHRLVNNSNSGDGRSLESRNNPLLWIGSSEKQFYRAENANQEDSMKAKLNACYRDAVVQGLSNINKKLRSTTDDDELKRILEAARTILTTPLRLQRDYVNSAELQLLAAEILRMIAVEKGISVATFDEATRIAVPILLKLLSSCRTDIAIRVLQEIEKAEDDEDFRYSIDLYTKGFASLIGDIIKIDEPVALLRAATAAIKIHLSNSDLYIVPYVKFQKLMPKLLQLMQLDDIEILANVCYSVIQLLNRDDYQIILEEITRSEAKLVSRLFSLLSSSSAIVLIPTMNLLIKLVNVRTNISGKQLAQVATVMVESFRWWDRETFLNMLDEEILVPILRNFCHDGYNIKIAVAILSNYIIKVKNTDKFVKLLEYGVVEVGCNLLLSPNREHLHDGLRLMYCLAMRAGKEKMEYAAQVRIKSMKGALYKLKELRAPSSFITREVTADILKKLKIDL
ncbi:Importin subunit alpha-1b [Trichoplax sp. H2]|nr:Importin subunit alpha-1b [Trichoplax sp. H2]|eukprot:RDD42292.1 Importin subunit alpha-1b [Trichoplax sp. H2]